MAITKPFKGGIPYGPDLAILDATFPDLEPGGRVSYIEIESTINTKYSTNRWKGILSAWKKRLIRDRGLEIGYDHGEALLILTAQEALGQTVGEVRSMGRRVGRTSRKAMRIKRHDLTPEAQQQLDHTRLITTRIAAAYIAETKELPKAPGPLPSLPVRKLHQLK